MKKRIPYALIACMLLTCFILTACRKDAGFRTMKIYTPVYKSSADVRAEIKTGDAQSITAAGKMFLYGNYIFLNELNKGIHIIDNSNPSSPINKAFISIPGNLDIAVKGNTLYADCYTDLLAVDISSLQNIRCKTFVPNLFPERAWVLNTVVPDGQVIVDWKVRDTTVEMFVSQGQGIWRNGEYYGPIWSGGVVFNDGQAFELASSSSGPTKSNGGKAGSTSRLAIVNNYLYTASATQLSAINISSPSSPQLKGTTYTGVNAQTIFPFKNKLFLGGANGFSVFNIDNASEPEQEGGFGHFCSDDPIIADDSVAYVTLHTGNRCEGTIDELDVVDISNLQNPQMIRSYPLNGPNGLSKDGNLLFICDGTSGLKIFDAAKPCDIKLLKTVSITSPYDVICVNKIAFVSAGTSLYQFDYHDLNNIKQLSKIALLQ